MLVTPIAALTETTVGGSLGCQPTYRASCALAIHMRPMLRCILGATQPEAKILQLQLLRFAQAGNWRMAAFGAGAAYDLRGVRGLI